MSLSLCASVLSRSFSVNRANMIAMRPRAGQKFRVSQGVPRSGNETGPLHNLHDFHFVDGKLPDLTKTMRQSQNAVQREEQRFQQLSQEMVELHEEWAEIDAVQNSASKVAKAPRVGKKIVTN